MLFIYFQVATKEGFLVKRGGIHKVRVKKILLIILGDKCRVFEKLKSFLELEKTLVCYSEKRAQIF